MKKPVRATSRLIANRRWLARLGETFTRDCFSRYERYLKWARDPLAVLILAANASALCGLFLHPQGFVLAFGLAGDLRLLREQLALSSWLPTPAQVVRSEKGEGRSEWRFEYEYESGGAVHRCGAYTNIVNAVASAARAR